MPLGSNTSLSSSAASLSGPNYGGLGGGGLGGEAGMSLAQHESLAALAGYAMPLDRWTPNTREWRVVDEPMTKSLLA